MATIQSLKDEEVVLRGSRDVSSGSVLRSGLSRTSARHVAQCQGKGGFVRSKGGRERDEKTREDKRREEQRRGEGFSVRV